MNLELKPEVAAALGTDADTVRRALDALAVQRLEPHTRFEVTRLKNILCVKPSRELHEP